MAPRKRKQVPAKSSEDRRKTLAVQMNLFPALSAASLIERNRIVQSHSLDSLFHSLASVAQKQQGLKNMEGMMKLALRAQNQCRTTIETLSAVKNPRQAVALVGQANIAGVQQVNNNTAQEPARAEDKKKAPNKLMEITRGKERMDAGTTPANTGDDLPVEAVGAVDWAAHTRR